MTEEQTAVFVAAGMIWGVIALILAIVIHHIHFGKKNGEEDQ